MNGTFFPGSMSKLLAISHFLDVTCVPRDHKGCAPATDCVHCHEVGYQQLPKTKTRPRIKFVAGVTGERSSRRLLRNLS